MSLIEGVGGWYDRKTVVPLTIAIDVQGCFMKIEVLREFVILARYGNFREAAKRMFLSQSALSSHIKGLEIEVGFELFDRSRGNALTEAGSILLQAAQTACEALDLAVEECRQLEVKASDTESPARVAVFASDPEIYHLLEKHCNCSYRYVEYDSSRPALGLFEQDDVDIMCTYDLDSVPALRAEAEELGLAYEPFGVNTCAVAMKESHPLACGSLARRGLANTEIVILNGLEFEYWKSIISAMVGSDSIFRFRLVPVTSLINMKLVDLGDSVLICTATMIQKYFHDRPGYVVKTRVDGMPLTSRTSLLYRPGSGNSNVEEVLQVLRNHAV